MNLFNFVEKIKQHYYEDYTTTALKTLIIAWSVFVIVLVLFIDNKWLLAGILAYEVLP